MQAFLFNILTNLRSAKDLIVTAGPTTLRAAADAMHRVDLAFQQLANYIEQYGPLIQFSPGGAPPENHPDLGPDGVRHLQELNQLKAECQAELDKVAQAPDAARGPLMDWIRNIDPAVKSAILKFIIDIISKAIAPAGENAVVPVAASAVTPRRTK